MLVIAFQSLVDEDFWSRPAHVTDALLYQLKCDLQEEGRDVSHELTSLNDHDITPVDLFNDLMCLGSGCPPVTKNVDGFIFNAFSNILNRSGYY